jgi:hypothetical protein
MSSPSTLDLFVKLLATTDGRDKIYKFTQNLSKLLAFAASDKATIKKWTGLSKSLGEGRSIMRMCKWVNNVQKLQGFAAKVGSLSQLQIIEIMRVLGDFGYVLGDNLAFLSKYGLIPLNKDNVSKNSKIFQFWGFFFATLLDILSILDLKNQSKLDAAAKAKKAKELRLSFLKNLSDMLVTLAAVGYLQKVYNPSAGVTSVLGMVSAGIATYQNWQKVSK